MRLAWWPGLAGRVGFAGWVGFGAWVGFAGWVGFVGWSCEQVPAVEVAVAQRVWQCFQRGQQLVLAAPGAREATAQGRIDGNIVPVQAAGRGRAGEPLRELMPGEP